jgi:pimeloyl-ACP methyl ester carboxylesterase
MALDAAADPRLSGNLDFVSSFGGYADAKRLLVDVGSRTTLNEDGSVSPWLPDSRIRQDVLELSIQKLPDDGQRARLRDVLGPIVAADERTLPRPVDSVDSFTGDDGHIFDLFTAADRQTAQAAVDALSPDLRAQLDGISPLTYADRIGVPVYLLHGVNDNAIPFAHAAELREALDGRVQRLTQFGRFGHGQPGVGGLSLDDAPDIVALALYLRDVVAVGQGASCRFGAGVVPFQACLRTLRDQDYGGALSVEHEPEGFDPTPDCIASLALLQHWLAGVGAFPR